jgi:hypothetical protein
MLNRLAPASRSLVAHIEKIDRLIATRSIKLVKQDAGNKHGLQ